MRHESPSSRATVAIYDRPPWWRRRRVLRVGLSIAVALASLVVWYAMFA